MKYIDGRGIHRNELSEEEHAKFFRKAYACNDCHEYALCDTHYEEWDLLTVDVVANRRSMIDAKIRHPGRRNYIQQVLKDAETVINDASNTIERGEDEAKEE